MKKNECMQNEIHGTHTNEPLLNLADRRVARKSGGNLRKMFIIASLAGIGLFLNGCVAGYVETEPAYGVSYRTPPPSSTHIWIDGGWGWNGQSHGYVQRSGYWEQPRQGQTYISGSWQSSSRGKYWQNGHWQKNYNGNNGNGRNNRNGKNNGNNNGYNNDRH
jgi:hypothetical protein